MKKIISVKSLEKVISKLKAKGKKVVLCHGVFDLLHIGHIKHFKEAKKLGNILVATVTQDKYVNKGPNRPIFSLNTRMESIAALKDIDYVAPNIFSNDFPNQCGSVRNQGNLGIGIEILVIIKKHFPLKRKTFVEIMQCHA